MSIVLTLPTHLDSLTLPADAPGEFAMSGGTPPIGPGIPSRPPDGLASSQTPPGRSPVARQRTPQAVDRVTLSSQEQALQAKEKFCEECELRVDLVRKSGFQVDLASKTASGQSRAKAT